MQTHITISTPLNDLQASQYSTSETIHSDEFTNSNIFNF